MRTDDVLRVIADLHTFTAADLAVALDVPIGTAGGWLSVATRKGYVERIRCGKAYLYSLSARARRRVSRLPAIDPEERCLLLVHVTVTERYMYHNGTPVIDTGEDELPVIVEPCRDCGEMYCNLPVTGRCSDCERKWHS